jgi:hypothetical protein
MHFLHPPKLSLAGMKAQRREGVRIILLGDNIFGKEVMLRPDSFHGVGDLISIGHVYTQFWLAWSLPQHNWCESPYMFYHTKSYSLHCSYPSANRF